MGLNFTVSETEMNCFRTVSETEMNWKCGDEECIYCGDEESVYQEKTWKKIFLETLMFCGVGIGSIVAAIIMSIVSLFVLGGVVVGVLFMLNVISNMLK